MTIPTGMTTVLATITTPNDGAPPPTGTESGGGLYWADMASLYLKDVVAELRRVGEVVFKSRYRAPMLVVVGKAGELSGANVGYDQTMVAKPNGSVEPEFALIDRVFVVTKAPHAPRGPVGLGRSGENDIVIPEYSLSKRHCFFEFEPAGTKITDCGSTNGTIVGDLRIGSGESAKVGDGTRIAMGRFAFVFHTAAGFHAHVQDLLP